MTFTVKAYIPCPLTNIIKLFQIKNEVRFQHQVRVVTKDNLKTGGNKSLLLAEQRDQNDEYLPQTVYPYNGRIGVNHVT